MTLKRQAGKWSMKKIALLFGIFASIAMCVDAAPTFFAYCRAISAPWTAMPNRIEQVSAKVDAVSAAASSMQSDLAQIKEKLNIREYETAYVTNKLMEK